jgi:general secretion pathway protein N
MTHFVPSLNAAQLGGQLQLNSEKISISDDTIKGSAILIWSQVNSPLSPVNPLGQYQALLNGVGNTLSIQLNTLNGALQLAGNGNWSKPSGLRFQGYATAQEPHKLALTPLLHILGNEEVADTGKFQFGIQP